MSFKDKKILAALCYCPCCCLSDDPADSEPKKLGSTDEYHRRIDCTCKHRWPRDPLFLNADHFLRTLLMRARDLGRHELSVAVTASMVRSLVERLS